MQSIYWTGRILSRALWNGITNISSVADSQINNPKSEPRLVSVACGFPKERVRRMIKGQFGDDAWFSAKYNTTADVMGVADGVGGWRTYGIDPGEFSSFLMRTCERLVTSGQFNPCDPSDLLARSYYELLEHKKPILGSSTACVVILNKKNNRIYTANIGDSGYMVVRKGNIIRRSAEQQHYFNTPFQLSLPPPGHQQNVLSDRPESADTDDFPVEDGDVILLATDGVFDNVPDEVLVSELRKAQGVRSATTLQTVANCIALIARKLAFDRNYMSPFAQSAQDNGINAVGGKPDDITVLLATVAL
ncbi:protein phosphatase PTC7 homolog [Chrysoperla carnea]|uniref:protein phosphatase PTC7 homolog n=1 Tax=Chrysoperla carnea TaxID=189513 RepID=UPI001D08487A|nr:protein phosphatase PTC7 homolog [Chrysoperla carnea]